MISAAQWVPRGAAAENPVKVDLDEAEMTRISELAKLEFEDAEQDLADAQAVPPAMVDHASSSDDEDDEDLKEYDMKNYDDETDDAIGGVHALQYHDNDDNDEYLTLPTQQEIDEEQEDLRVLPTDNMLLAAKTEDDVSLIEVYVYDDSEARLYVHHDFMIPSFPLCLEWVPTRPYETEKKGNFVAIGTFEPEIELWDLDVIDGVFPAAILGGRQPGAEGAEARGTGKKKRKMKKPNGDYHVDAVLALSSNPNHVNLLASGSADTTIKLWDLQKPEVAAASFMGYHKNKVSSLQWHRTDATVLLSGGYDGYARVGDLRSDNLEKASRKFKVTGDIENVSWGRAEHEFFVATDRGVVQKFDARADGSKPVWTLQAHDAEVTSFSVNQFTDDFMVTASTDKQIKLWNLANDKPSMLLSRDMDVGRVFSVGFGPERATRGRVVVAGSESKLKVWDVFSNRTVREAVAKDAPAPSAERVVQPDSSDEDEDEDEDAEVEIVENEDI